MEPVGGFGLSQTLAIEAVTLMLPGPLRDSLSQVSWSRGFGGVLGGLEPGFHFAANQRSTVAGTGGILGLHLEGLLARVAGGVL